MGLKCGIVGLPNAGKSTLFNALTAGNAAAENYAFCTIEPNTGAAPLDDPRLKPLAHAANSKKTVPAAANFTDIAGLIAGAAKGGGLGNRFLAHIRETDGIAHVVRCFDSGNITHVNGKVAPEDDIAVINTELALADMETAEKILAKNAKIAKSGDKNARALCEVCEKLIKHLGEGGMARRLALNENESALVKNMFLLTMKPVVYAANVGEDGFHNNPHLDAVRKTAEMENAAAVPVCAQMEADLAGLSETEKTELLKDYGLEQTGLSRMARAAFDMLGLATYFTAGEKETRAWTFRRGMSAPEAAGVIHTDFTRGFIRAEVCGWEDFVNCGGENGARAAGKLRSEGKDYAVQDGDVMHFRFNV